MTLYPHPHFPSTRSYVLKLHRDAMPQLGQVAGRLENLASGHCFEFNTTEQLLVMLATNEIMTVVALAFVLSALIIWLAPKPMRKIDMMQAGH